MIAELGVFCLIISTLFALLLGTIPLLGIWKKNAAWRDATAYYVPGQFFFIAAAFVCMALCFMQNDFTVTYVMLNSSVSLPWFYKVCAVWGGHEGSMLLWVLILSGWMLAVNFFSKALDPFMRARVLVTLGWLSFGLLLFLLSTSNPFIRQFQELNTQGRDLNPLLQDPGFLFHPPMLYMGYVGFSVAFSFAIAALWTGRLESSWAKWTRPWTLAAWCCLTAGITLGSWWAYRELGWGGWWFWDPVENASLMPWLVGTALIHSLAVSEKRQQFRAWTILLAISAFSLSLIGTFLVRSGVLTSVHAFAVDPDRGLFILCYLIVVIGGSLLLFAVRAKSLQAMSSPSVVSRDSALLLNNVFLFVMTLTILLGTVYPLLIDALGLGKLSVGAPYFNTVFIPMMIPMTILMGIGMHLKWQKDTWGRIRKQLGFIAVCSCGLPIMLLFMLHQSLRVQALLGLILASWVVISSVQSLLEKIKSFGVSQLSRAYWGMLIAHCGVAVTMIGITVSSTYGVQDDVRLAPGEQAIIAGYQVAFLSEKELVGANYHGTQAVFQVTHKAHRKIIYPEKRVYHVGRMAMTDSAIDVSPFRDIYVALGEPIDQSAWSVRLYYKPLIRWIWGGGFMILLGGLLALCDRRYYRRQRQINSVVVPT